LTKPSCLQNDIGQRQSRIWVSLLAITSAVGSCTLAVLPPRWYPTEFSPHRLTGRHYEGIINIPSPSATALFPSSSSNRYDNPPVASKLLTTSGAMVLVIEPDLFVNAEYPIPYRLARSEKQVSNSARAGLRLDEIQSCAGTDSGYIVHSSSTTNGKPKPIHTPCALVRSKPLWNTNA